MGKVRDWGLKTELLQMIEWDHKSRYGWEFGTWDNGAHMREWMDSEIIAALGASWPGLSSHEMAAALSNSVGHFDTLRRHTAIALGIAPFENGSVLREIERVLRLLACFASGETRWRRGLMRASLRVQVLQIDTS